MTARQIAVAIMADIVSRKGLGAAWREWWGLTSPATKEAVLEAWERLIEAKDEA